MGTFDTPGGKGNIRRAGALAKFLNERLRRPPAPTAPERPPVRHRLLFEAMEQRVLLAADPLPAFVVASVNGSLDVTGETDRYTFTLDNATRVVFDSLTNTDRINWSLSGPGGSVVSSRALSQSDSVDFNSNPVLNLEAGEYLLTVDGTQDATGDYGFRLLDLGKGDELADGVAQEQTLDPANQTRVYRFVGGAGDRFFLDVTSRSGGDVYWRLLDPLDRLVFSSSEMNYTSQDRELSPLPLDGTYTLLVEGRSYTTGTASYGLTLHKVEDPAGPATIAIGESVSGTIAMPGQWQSYEFTIGEDSMLLFDALTNSAMTWSLVGPLGTEISGRRFDQSDGSNIGGNPLLRLAAGTYTLTIDGVGDARGDFGFRVLDLAVAESFVPGSEVSGTLANGRLDLPDALADSSAPLVYPEGETNRALLLNGSGRALSMGDRSSLRMGATFTIEAWIRPTAAGTGGAGGGIIVNKEGEYEIARFADGTIRWAFANSNPGWTWIDTGYVAALDEWTHVAVSYDNGTVRTYANGTLVHTYEGAGALGDVDGRNDFRVGAREGAEQGFIGLIDEVRVWNVARTGAQIAARHDELLGGSETGLVGYWRMDETDGPTVADLSSQGNHGTLLAPPTETRLYRFTATAGQRFFFDAIASAQSRFSIRVFDPLGNSVLSSEARSFTDSDVFTAAFDGEYVIALEGRIDNASYLENFRFVVHDVEDLSDSLAPGTLVEGEIAHPGQRVHYTFTLAETSTLLFDSRTYDSSNRLNWTLSGPRGVEVSARSFVYSDSAEYGSNPLLELVAGTYTLTVDASGDATPEFAFLLAALSQAEAIALDEEVAGALDPGNATAIYRFNATAGDEVVFDRLSLSAGSPTGGCSMPPAGSCSDRNISRTARRRR